MYLSRITAQAAKRRRQTVELGGLDRTEGHRDGALADSVGLSCAAWPCLRQRGGRARLEGAGTCTAVFAWDKLCQVRGSELLYDGAVVGAVTPGEKQFAVVNTKLVIFPDKKYLDLSTEPKAFKSLDAKVTSKAGTVVTLTEDTLTMQGDAVLGDMESSVMPMRPKRPTSGSRSGTVHYIKAYDTVAWTGSAWETTGEADLCTANFPNGVQPVGKYVIFRDTGYSGGYALNVKEVEETVAPGSSRTSVTKKDYGPDSNGIYGKILSIQTKDISDQWYYEYYVYQITFTIELHDGTIANDPLTVFKKGDVVTLSGCAAEENNRDLRVAEVTGTALTFDTPVLTPGQEAGCVTVERRVPDLDFICASDNRLFGVSNEDRMIYASALGDPTNFNVYQGLSTDSYALAVGSPGDFTGCIAYSGGVLFWKEDCLHRLLGSYPAAYELYTDQIAGLQAGSARSMVILNEVLYYKGREGVYAYAGATPRLTSAPLGPVGYTAAAAGSSGRNYYISMRRRDTGTWELLVLDTVTGLWIKEEDRRAEGFAQLEGTLYMLSEGEITALDQGEDDGGEPVSWEALFTPFTETVHERKYPSRLLLRLELAPGAWAEAELSRDGGPFQRIWTGRGGGRTTAAIPIRPGRCDKYQLRLRGEGRCTLRSMAREFSLGGVQ